MEVFYWFVLKQLKYKLLIFFKKLVFEVQYMNWYFIINEVCKKEEQKLEEMIEFQYQYINLDQYIGYFFGVEILNIYIYMQINIFICRLYLYNKFNERYKCLI